jgi:hypothetical protein
LGLDGEKVFSPAILSPEISPELTLIAYVLSIGIFITLLPFTDKFSPTIQTEAAGSQEAGKRVGAILSIVETCRRLGLPIRDLCAKVTEAYSFEGLRYLNQFPVNFTFGQTVYLSLPTLRHDPCRAWRR